MERATIQLDLTTSRHVGMGQSPEAGYNLEEAHHTGWKPELAVLVGACGLQRQDTTIWPAETRNTATLETQKSQTESDTTQTSLSLNDLTLRLRENPPFYLKAII